MQKMGILSIAIETGIFIGLTENKWIFQLWLDPAVENEQHLLCTCSLYILCKIMYFKDV